MVVKAPSKFLATASSQPTGAMAAAVSTMLGFVARNS